MHLCRPLDSSLGPSFTQWRAIYLMQIILSVLRHEVLRCRHRYGETTRASSEPVRDDYLEVDFRTGESGAGLQTKWSQDTGGALPPASSRTLRDFEQTRRAHAAADAHGHDHVLDAVALAFGQRMARENFSPTQTSAGAVCVMEFMQGSKLNFARFPDRTLRTCCVRSPSARGKHC